MVIKFIVKNSLVKKKVEGKKGQEKKEKKEKGKKKFPNFLRRFALNFESPSRT